MRRSAFESLQRGARNVLVNWELVLVQMVAALVVTLLTLAGAVPLLAVIGFETVRSLLSEPRFGVPPLAGIDAAAEQLTAAVMPLVIALLVACAVWTVALIASAYFQAGTFGVLAAGESRAAALEASRWEFRAFSLREFTASAERRLWRFFWLVNVFLLFGSAVVALMALGLGITAWFIANEAAAAAGLTGCATVLAVVMVAVGLGVWWQLSLASAALHETSVWASVGVGLSILVKRLGAVVVVLLALAAAGLTLVVVFLPAAMIVEFAVRDVLWIYVTVQIAMSVVQSLLSGVLGLLFSGAIIALVRSEAVQASGAVA